MVIENFAALSEDEVYDFAEKLLKTINSEKSFLDDELVLEDAEADELSGDLVLLVRTSDTLEVEREGTWSCGYSRDEDEQYDLIHAAPSTRDVEFADIEKDVVAAKLKAKSVEIEGYTAAIEIEDVVELDCVEVLDVINATEDDDGYGDYEYFGFRGTDSRPYVEVTGRVRCEADVAFSITVAPTVVEVEPEAEEV